MQFTDPCRFTFDPPGRTLSERTLLAPDLREFWKKLCGLVAPTADGGGIDIFSPLAASGMKLFVRTHTLMYISVSLLLLVSPSSLSLSTRSGSHPGSLCSHWSGSSGSDGSRYRKFPEQWVSHAQDQLFVKSRKLSNVLCDYTNTLKNI